MIHCVQKDLNEIKCNGCICYLECPPNIYDNGPTTTLLERMIEVGYIKEVIHDDGVSWHGRQVFERDHGPDPNAKHRMSLYVEARRRKSHV